MLPLLRGHTKAVLTIMLPNVRRGDDGESARYGVYALEPLVNKVLAGGGKCKHLEVKVFGGGRVIDSGNDIGRSNIELVRRFFAAEAIPIASEDLGDPFARRVRYWPRSGRAQVQRIPMVDARQVVATEQRVSPQMSIGPGASELF